MRNNTRTTKQKGFTLLEILLVVAAIGILAAIVIVAINPNRQLAKVRNSERQSEINTVLDGTYQYIIDNNGAFPSGLTGDGTVYSIKREGASSCDATNSIALEDELVPDYLAEIPEDPQVDDLSTTGCTGYTITRTSSDRITVASPNTEQPPADTSELSVTR